MDLVVPCFFDAVDWREKLQNLMERQKEVEAREKQFEKRRREREDWRDEMRLETQVPRCRSYNERWPHGIGQRRKSREGGRW